MISAWWLATAMAGASSCTASPEARILVAPSTTQWLMVGEAGHGTNEMPRVAADLVCAAVERHRPVVVALEYAAKYQPVIDAYLVSDGGPSARGTLMASPLWDPDWADGKSSRAMRDLIEWLRQQHRLGRVHGVVAFDADAGRGAVRERAMAERLLAAPAPAGGLVIALTGSFHARKQDDPADPASYTPAAGLLPPAATFSLRVEGNGGWKWACMEKRCGVHAVPASNVRGRTLDQRRTTDGGYDAVLYLGVSTTASPPAKTPTYPAMRRP